ncbi:MAG: DUF4932 domain-containing protein [Candidatus Vecturithrix sp.]|jgi:hypothetical protein|nr:DUF4932 domain-containing protein [Candidatus Vecturithrix sp.]
MDKRQVIGIFIIILWCCVIANHLVAEEIQHEEYGIVLQVSNKLYAEILPRMELLSGVLSHTSWMEQEGPDGKGNQYFQALHEFFAPYQHHEAMQLAESFIQREFVYDAPPCFILHLSPLPDLAPIHGYSPYLLRRAGGKERLEAFRLALRDLAEQSNFLAFFQQQTSLLDHSMQTALSGFDGVPLTAWLERFYGWSIPEFRLVFAPAMFSGAYGAIVKTQKGEILYQVITEIGVSEQQPEFQTGNGLADLTLHEFGHGFVNPSVEQYDHLIEQFGLRDLFTPVADTMTRQAYGNVRTFLNETLVRSVTSLAVHDLYGDEERYHGLIRRHEQRGFYLTRFTIEQLHDYRMHRDQYQRFDDFVPYLLQQYADHKEMLLTFFRDTHPNRYGYLGVDITSVAEIEGVVVMKVFRNTPADKAGIKPGDHILSFDGIAVATPDALAGRVKDTQPGTTIALEIIRNGKPQTIQVTIEQWM